MSFKAVIQLVLNIDSYFIIEYPHQGLFTFHYAIYQLNGKNRNFAIPYQILTKNNQPIEPSGRIIVPSRIDDEWVNSSTGLAKYSDQIIRLDDWVQFRIQIESFPELQAQDVILEIQLRFNSNNISQPWSEGQLIETLKFRLNDIENGLFSYCQAEFSAPYLSRLRFTLLALLTTFKFSKYQMQSKQLNHIQRQRVKVNSMNELLNFARMSFPNQIIQNLFYINYIKKLRIAQYIMADKLNELKFIKQTVAIKLDEEYILKLGLLEVTQKNFKDYLDKYLPANVTIAQILTELNLIREENFNFMQRTLGDWMNDKINMDKCRNQFLLFQKEKYGERVFKSVLHGKQDIVEKKQLSSKENKKIAKQIRGKDIILNSYPIEDFRYEDSRQQQQIVFYQLTFPFKTSQQQMQQLQLTSQDYGILHEGCKIQYSQKHMLVVLCHGFQGSSYDMQLIKRWIQKQLPDAYYLIARCNQDNTDGDIRLMGRKLAEQIQNFIKNYMEEYEQENVIINLVGHSMGGVIARASLVHLDKYKHQMGFFCSLSSPHLGYLNGVSGLVKVGLWAIRRWKKIISLQQLSMEERGDPRKTFLYELSKTGHLRYFRKIILLSSFQDNYVSWHSARISGHRSKNSSSKIQQQMQDNILSNNLYGAAVHRLDINFNVKTNDLDSFIGRTAHINLIVRENLFKMLGVTIPQLFDLTQFGREGMFL